ncbi:LPO_1073/Vpar_1526 family protein [Elizabethkingia anophelis]|uniref:LPO_1073/Vpar_1526 family protein n=1 Tax=Elizabethkingia anophelis TaxID=1117645 RepID=UPI001F4B4E6D|nr:LPO_1073/Vpar_1526 family protein [Elizabethkingia anophelis]
MEPLSMLAMGAAVGGAAGKFVEKAWDSGEKWIQTFFKDHKEIAQQKATENTIDFLNELAKKVKHLEESRQISQEKINSAQDHPDFSALLQKALLASAQTDNKDKHVILARLVSERLKSEPESIFALCSKIACDSISYATINQLMILGLAVNFYGIRPNPYPPAHINSVNYQEWFDNWLIARLKPYQNIIFRPIDLVHLESLSCLRMNTFMGRNLNQQFQKDHLIYDFGKMKDVTLRLSMEFFWKSGLQMIDITTVGQIIGVSVSDLLTNTTTDFDGWE